MIEEQCNNCRNHNTAYCIIFDGRSCPAYTEEIDDTISSQEIAGDAPPIHYTAEGLKATTKIRGGIRWFLILIVLIGLGGLYSAIRPIATLNISEYGNSWAFALVGIMGGIMTFGIAIYTAIAFFRRSSNAVFIATLCILYVLLYGLMDEVIALIFSDLIPIVIVSGTAGIIGFSIVAIFFFRYLALSKQVRELIPQTYRKVSGKDYILSALAILILLLYSAFSFITHNQGAEDAKASAFSSFGIETKKLVSNELGIKMTVPANWQYEELPSDDGSLEIQLLCDYGAMGIAVSPQLEGKLAFMCSDSDWRSMIAQKFGANTEIYEIKRTERNGWPCLCVDFEFYIEDIPMRGNIYLIDMDAKVLMIESYAHREVFSELNSQVEAVLATLKSI